VLLKSSILSANFLNLSNIPSANIGAIHQFVCITSFSKFQFLHNSKNGVCLQVCDASSLCPYNIFNQNISNNSYSNILACVLKISGISFILKKSSSNIFASIHGKFEA
jgi:Na+-translocating ferredoxin:NAD+ oxidoreductase RnfC subunit